MIKDQNPQQHKCLLIKNKSDDLAQLNQALIESALLPCITSLCTRSEAQKIISNTLFDFIFIDIRNTYLDNSEAKTPESNDFKTINTIAHEAPGVPLILILSKSQEENFHRHHYRSCQDYLILEDKHWDNQILNRILRYTLSLKNSTDQIFRLLHFDELTGLANRHLCYDRIFQAILRAERSGQLVALLFIDLDNFHGINESLGYEVGDHLLKETASRLITCVRRQDTVARFGSDEFVIVLEGLNDPQHTTVIAKQILQCFSEPIFTQQQPIFVSPSIGISVSDQEMTDGRVLLKQADIARYRAKEQGGSNFQYFVPALNDVAQQRLNLERELSHALKRIFHKTTKN